MMGPQAIARIDDKLAAFEAALRLAVPATWTIEAGFVPYSEREDALLETVVVNLISEGEGSYSQARGMAAKEGTVKLLLITHLKVKDQRTRVELQQAEIDVMESLKTFTLTGITGMDVILVDMQQSRMLEHPYGWVVAYFELRPPGANTH